MAKSSTRNGIIFALSALFIIGGYIIYQTLSNPGRGGADRYTNPPSGRVFTVARTDMSVGISGVGIVDTTSRVQAVIGVKKEELGKITVNQKAAVWISELASTYNGSIISISDKPREAASGPIYDVAVSIDDSKDIREGMTADVQIILETRRNVLAVPSLTVLTDKDGNRYVWALPASWNEGQGDSTPPIRRDVKIGIMDERNAEIISGLSVGEKVIVPSNQR